ncbi:MAG: folate-binding protein YgfZ [Gammaproteobacteria bacterium]|nr:folate-binding protein YgfZ [Gammaproteobacteria bacterium]MBT5863912.1 folate-binding protein YgfZ [Gammaproteobacteria bacterium]
MNIRELSGYSKDPETVCLRISGEDAGKFLQGQLSNDIDLVEENIFQYSSYSTNQGKVIAILRILKDQNDYVILINKDISDYFTQKLSMYILMSKVVIERDSNYLVLGVCGKTLDQFLESNVGKDSDSFKRNDDYWVLNNDSKHFRSFTLVYKNKKRMVDEINVLTTTDELKININKLADYYNGILRINMETKEQYIPQVLNLEKLNGINYKKGCYTGQEIVARTHYLGKIKKQLFLIRHSSDKINISNKIHDENNEIVGDIMSHNQVIDREMICLAVIRLDSVDKGLFVNNKKVNIVN